MSARGKELFEARTEYPLPKGDRNKTKDYVFYFESWIVTDDHDDGFAQGAHGFLSRFYSNHVEKSVKSFEELIGFLDAQVAGGVEHIREVVIVAHGNARGLQAKLLEAASTTTHGEYRSVTFDSLAILQQDFADNKFQAFKKKRERVVAHMTDKSWVTFRVCRFGSAGEALYATYAFFGGHANVYAPRFFQFFAWQPVGSGMRFRRRLDVHEHLVRQRFFPKDLHTDERKDVIVQFLANPGRYSEIVEVDASSAPESDASYEKLIDELNAGRIPPTMKDKLAAHEHTLTPKARVQIVEENRAWIIEDKVTHDGKTYSVNYEIWEEHATTGKHVSLKAAARIADDPSLNEEIPVQSFFGIDQNEMWRGTLFTLASYIADPSASPPIDPTKKAAFDSVVTELGRDKVVAGSKLQVQFADEMAIDVSGATITRTGTTGPWLVKGQATYRIKLEHPMQDENVEGHMLAVFPHLTDKAKKDDEHDKLKWLGDNPDTPGTELAAYFDTIETADLMAVIDHLRAPYREVNSFYIHHAVQALARKRDYHVWAGEEIAALPTNEVLAESPYLQLAHNEHSDKNGFVYSFDFNKHWAEVKMSFPSIPAFTTDLFVIEHNLWKKFRTTAFDRNAPIVEAESPGLGLERTRKREAERDERYDKVDKSSLEPAPRVKITCEELAALITKWKTLEGQTVEEIQKQLELAKGPTGKSLFATLKDLYDLWSLFNKLKDVTSLEGGFHAIANGLVVKIVEKIPWFAPNALGLPSLGGLLARMWGVIGVIKVPFDMWMKFLDEQVKVGAIWKMNGKALGVRRYLRALIDWTASSDYPDRLAIDFDPNDYERLYFQERLDIWHIAQPRVFYDGGEVKAGFVEGVKLMKELGPQIVAHAQDLLSDALLEMGFDACMGKVLVDAGVLDLAKLRAKLIRELAWHMLDEVRKL